MGISRRHLLVEFNDSSHVVVKDLSKMGLPGQPGQPERRGGNVSYQDDHYRHATIGNPEHPPTWVIPPGRKVEFHYGSLWLEILVPDHQSHLDQYLHRLQMFRTLQNNPISLMGGLGLDSQTLTASGPGSGQEPPLPGDKHGRYAWITGKQLGKGAFGEVIEMFNSTTWAKRAGKKMDHRDFQHESSLLRSLNHPHIAKYIDEEKREGVSYHLIMELCPLKDLGQQHQELPLSEDEVRKVFAQATSALQYLHGQGVTHRDLKPGNILVRSRQPDLDIALSDFGLATKDKELMSTFGCGTYMYMAPEVVARSTKDGSKVDVKYDKQADIWSMGLVALALLLPGGLPRPAGYGIDIQGNGLDQRYAHKMLGVREEFLAQRRGQDFARLVGDMIKWNPAHRPTAQQCAERAASVLAASSPSTEDYPSDQPDTGLLNRSPQGEKSAHAVKRKEQGTSAQETVRPRPKRPRQAAAAHAAEASKPSSTGGRNASGRQAARSSAPSASAEYKGPTTRSLAAALEQELANEGLKTPTSASLRAELDREVPDASESLQTTGLGEGYVLRGSGPTSTYQAALPRNSSATPDEQASTISSAWMRANGLDFTSRRETRASSKQKERA